MKCKQTMTEALFTTISFERNFVENKKDIPKCTLHFLKKRDSNSGNLNYTVSHGGFIKNDL